MKWLSISSDTRQKVYELRTKKEKLLTLTFHPGTGTIRISTNDEKRVFLVGLEGFLRNKTVLRNEYGIRIGQLHHEGNQESHGTIEISDEPYQYILQENLPLKAAIYKNNEMLVVCELPDILKISQNRSEYEMLILALSWYVAVAVKNVEEEYA